VKFNSAFKGLNYISVHTLSYKGSRRKQNIERRVEETGRRERRRKQLLDVVKETKRYWKLKEKALYLTLWRTRLGRGYEPVARQTT
jgi:hypothetical protein